VSKLPDHWMLPVHRRSRVHTVAAACGSLQKEGRRYGMDWRQVVEEGLGWHPAAHTGRAADHPHKLGLWEGGSL